MVTGQRLLVYGLLLVEYAANEIVPAMVIVMIMANTTRGPDLSICRTVLSLLN